MVLFGVKKLILIGMILIILGASPRAFAFDDIANHWAQDSIKKWSDWGIVFGYNNKYNPDTAITRAEFVAIAGRIFNGKNLADNTFTDLNDKKWYYDDIRRAVAMGILYGNGNNTITPESPLLREQAAVILTHLFHLTPKGMNKLADYRDNALIAPWAREAFSAITDHGYMQGSNGLLRPKEAMTKAEAAAVFDRFVKSLTINEKWISSGNISGNTVISIPNVEVKDAKIDGNLYIADGVGEGSIALKDSIVSRDITVRGGGTNSVLLDNIKCSGDINIYKKNGSVQVTVTNSTRINGYIMPHTEAVIVSQGSEAKIEIPADLPGNSEITIIGNCAEVFINSKDANIIFENAAVSKMTLTSDSENNKITLNPLTFVDECNINGSASIAGDGRIESATVNAANVTIAKMPSIVTIAPDVIVTIDDKDYSETTGTSVPVKSVSINEKGLISGLTVGNTVQVSTTINPQSAAHKTITWNSSDTDIATVNSTGLVTAHRFGSVTITAEADGKSDFCVIDIEPTPWDGSTRIFDWYTSVANGQYVIQTPEDFAGFAAIVGGTAEGIKKDNFSGAEIKLGNNINLDNREWTPIADVFAGTFDGNGKTISNLSFHGAAAQYSGLFSKVQNGLLKNIIIEESNIMTSGYTGILAGYIENTQINSCTVSGTLTGEGYEAIPAGIVEYAKNSSIAGCTNNAFIQIVNGDSVLYVAGIVCELSGSTVDGCINNGRINALYSEKPSNEMYTYAAGIAVYLKNNSKVMNCMNNGAVSTTGGAYGSAGGIAGLAFEERASTSELISGCTNNGNITATAQDTYAGGIVSEVYPGENGITVKDNSNSAVITINSGASEITDNTPAVGTIIGWCSEDKNLKLGGNTNTGSVAASGREYDSNGLYGNFLSP